MRRLRGEAPLEGSWRGAPERCYRTESFPQGSGLCRGRFDTAEACSAQPKNLSWMARVARSASALSMRTETLISLVEII